MKYDRLPPPLDEARYRDKVRGGWTGKCAGGILGAPIEGYKTFNEIRLTDELFASNFANDDLDLQLLWLDMVERYGGHVREAEFRRHWREHVAFPWNEYGIATRNIVLGLDIPDSGRYDNDYWSQSMGSPIRSEIWGMLFPGEPARATRYARIDSELDHAGFSVDAERYFSACASLAFVADDLDTMLDRGLEQLEAEGDCAKMVGRVSRWYADHGFATAAGKIKSFYGDADFTAAPLNVAFTVLALRHAGRDFDRIMEALHLGHDSDCIVATAGALIGIVVGYDALPREWKQRVGDELLVSPELQGIDCPATLTELTNRTVAAAARLREPAAADFPLSLRSRIVEAGNPQNGQPLRIVIELENLTQTPVEATLALTSDHYAGQRVQVVVGAGIAAGQPLTLQPLTPFTFPTAPTIPYVIALTVAGQTRRYQRGHPFYGEWLLLGPFVEADASLTPMDPDYPDHGMSSLPSVIYMNHDRVNPLDQEFLSPDEISELLDGTARDGRPYHSAVVPQLRRRIDLAEYFYGRGERTLYLATRLSVAEATKKWLCVGTTAYLTVWLNGQRVHVDRRTQRRWPATKVVELELPKGLNELVLRVDTVVDDYTLEVGLKDHRGKHHHQSFWDTTTVCGLHHSR